MSETLIAAILGTTSGLILGIASLYFAYRNLKFEYRGKFELEIIMKQISACEALWGVLANSSKSDGDERILIYQENQIAINKKNVKKLYDDINQIFNSPMGLYFSRDLRKNMFDLRDFINAEFLQKLPKDDLISKTKAEKFDGYVQNLRLAIRKEIGAVDLVVTKKGPLE